MKLAFQITVEKVRADLQGLPHFRSNISPIHSDTTGRSPRVPPEDKGNRANFFNAFARLSAPCASQPFPGAVARDVSFIDRKYGRPITSVIERDPLDLEACAALSAAGGVIANISIEAAARLQAAISASAFSLRFAGFFLEIHR